MSDRGSGIQAIQWTGDNDDQVRQFLGLLDEPEAPNVARPFGNRFKSEDGATLSIDTSEGRSTVAIGDWIIRDASGDLYSRSREIFGATYQAVDDTEASRG
jgi:hypothetical protein